MASNNIIGLSMILDTSSLKAGLEEASRRLNATSAEFKEATAGMDDWRKSSEGVSAKLKQLNDNLEIQKLVLARIEKEYEEAGYAQDDMSAAAINLRTRIAEQKATIGKTEKEIRKYDGVLEELVEAEKDTSESVDGANKKLNEQKGAADNAGEGFTVLKGTIANLLADGINALIGGIKDGISNLLALSEQTREYREDVGKLQAAFEGAGKSSDSATATYQKLYSAIGETDTAVEASQQIALLADSEKRAAEWADLATGVVGKFGDALKPETFYEAANETLKLGKATGAFTQMLEQSGINVEDFDKHLASLNTEEEKQAYMLEVSRGALSKAGEAYEKVNADVIEARKVTAEYTNTQADLGKKLEPVNTAITNFKNQLLQTLAENIDFEAVAKTLSDTLQTFADEVIPKVIDGFNWLKDNLPTIKSFVVGIGSAFAAFKVVSIITGIVKAVKAWTVATEGLTIAQKLFNKVSKANMIGIIVGAIVGLVALIVHLWKTNEDFRNAVIKIWESIKNAFKSAVDFIKVAWNGLVVFFKNLWESIKKIFSVVGTWFSNIFTSAKNGIVKAFSSVGQFFVNVWTGIKNTFSTVKSWFSNVFTDAWSAIKKVFSNVGSFFGGIWDTIKSKFTDIGQKVGDTISSTFKKAVNSLLSTAETVLNKPIKAINSLRKIINKVPGVSIGKLEEFSLPRMALGGIVDKATLGIVGEDGQEAVIPLERNLGWIKKLSANIVKEMQVPNLNGVTNSISNNTTQFTQIINAPKQPPLDEMYRHTGNLINMKVVS